MIISSEYEQSEEKCTCKICDKSFKRLKQHLKVHDISYEEYLNRYEASKYADYLKVKELTDFLYEYYIEDNTKGLRYLYYKKENNGEPRIPKYSIYRTRVENHVRGIVGVGIFFDKSNNSTKKTSLIAFDLDTLDKAVLKAVVKVIKGTGVSKKSILITFSGSKGYHIDIFLNRSVSHDEAKKYFNHVRGKVLEKVSVDANKIEGRGFTDAGYKLPFGVHFGTGNRCQVLNEDGTFVEDTFKVLRKIKKQDSSVITSIAKEAKAEDLMVKNKAPKTKENLEIGLDIMDVHNFELTLPNIYHFAPILLEVGVHEEGYRNHNIFSVAVYLRDCKGYNQNQAVTRILKWMGSKWSSEAVKGHSKTVKAVVESTYKYKKGLLSDKSRPQKLILSKSNIDNLITLETNSKGILQEKSDQGKTEICLKTSNKYRRILLALIIQSKLYLSDDGYFSLAYDTMQGYGVDIKNKATLKKMILDLQSWGYIEAVEFGKKESALRKASNRYKLAEHIQPSVERLDEQIESVHNIDLSSENPFFHLYDLAVALLEDSERKRIVQGKAYADTKKRLAEYDVSPAESLEEQFKNIESILNATGSTPLKAVAGGYITDVRDVSQNEPRRGEIP